MRSRVAFLTALFFASTLAVPLAAHAAIPFFGPIIPAGNLQECAIGWAGLIIVINNIISFAITIAIVFVAPIMIAYSGFLLVVNPFNPGAQGQAKKILLSTIVGIVIALASWLIVDAVMAVLYNPTTVGATWSSLVTSGGLDPCLKQSASLSNLNIGGGQTGGGITTGSGGSSGGGGCAGNLICGTNNTCQIDPSVDNTDGQAGSPCNPNSPNCVSGLTCDITGTCSASGTTNGIAAGQPCTQASSGGGGSCPAVQTSGGCAVSNMGVFGAAANQASQICFAESSGNASIPSSSDYMHNDPQHRAFSWGLFQINLTQHQVAGLNCPSAFIGSNYSATVKDESLYAQCVAAVKDPGNNIAVADSMYVNDNDSWHEWSTAKNCGFSLITAPSIAQTLACINSGILSL